MSNHFPLRPLKVHYFLMGAGAAPILPFLPIIGKQMGISGSGVGFILALVQISGLVIKPSFGYLMDKYPSRKKSLLQLLMLTALISMNCLKHTSPLDSTYEKSINLTQCEPKIKAIANSIKPPDPCLKHKLHSFYNFDHDCELQCQKTSFDTKFDGSSASIEDHHLTYTLCMIVWSFFKNCVNPF